MVSCHSLFPVFADSTVAERGFALYLEFLQEMRHAGLVNDDSARRTSQPSTLFLQHAHTHTIPIKIKYIRQDGAYNKSNSRTGPLLSQACSYVPGDLFENGVWSRAEQTSRGFIKWEYFMATQISSQGVADCDTGT